MIATINLFGLALNALGSVVLIRYPSRVSVLTECGEPSVTFVGNVPPDGDKIGARHTRWSKAGPALLTVGFVLQIVAALAVQ
ncbi:hypothetical protein C0Q88_25315 [Ralstonia pickettii]|uniref:Uncharacterized protein n=1 Tax=Ralstonia pickettii TaxID=329 RepID=A0A2N4TJY5_RALPI|nr:hypothetical protein C0Q88_25315 [Ralstonia pickettii]